MRRALRIVSRVAWIFPCLFYFWAVLPAPTADGADLHPLPDAQEYALIATRLAQFQPPLLEVGMQIYPSRYPLTYPLLLVPIAWGAQFDMTRYFWGSALFGLIATVLIARTGSWLLGSRWAGALAATFWALHPETVHAATVNMSENGVVMMFMLAMELARPWLDRGARPRTLLRASLLGLVLGWLTVSKIPFAYLAIAFAAMMLLDALDTARWRPLSGLIAAAMICVFADVCYRRWAFGSWGDNGYAYWAPDFYAEISRTFNFRFLRESWDPTRRGNLLYYSQKILGQSHDFYSRYMVPSFIAAAIGLLWTRRVGRPLPRVVWLLAGWLLVGTAFCLLYFFQSERFPHLWVVVIDMVVAWGLVRMPYWGLLRRRRLTRIAQCAALIAVAVLLRGEILRVHGIHHAPDNPRIRVPYADQIRSLVDHVPADAWLFTAYQPILVDRWRANDGPTAGLYAWHDDASIMNGHMMAALMFDLLPRALAPDARRYLATVPARWSAGPSLLIGPDNQWVLSAGERAALTDPVYILTLTPFWPGISAEHQRETILPMIRREWGLETIQSTTDVTLYLARRRDGQTTGTTMTP